MSRKGDGGKKQGRDKKKGGGQQQAKKRKHYSPDIPLRKLVRMLQRSGVEFTAKQVFPEEQKESRRLLQALAVDGAEGKYGDSVLDLAQRAIGALDKLRDASAPKKEISEKELMDQDSEMVELERLTRPDPRPMSSANL